MERFVSVAEARDDLPTLLEQVARGVQIVITRRGRRHAVLLNYGQLQTLQEVARLARDPQAQAAIARSDDDVRSGRVYSLKGRPSVRRILSFTARRKHAAPRG
jgi:prevent-host-death family protein